MLKRVIVGSDEAAEIFNSDEPYAVISFVDSWHGRRPTRIQHPPTLLGRIVVRADDCEPGANLTNLPDLIALSEKDARRVARFVRRLAPQIETLLIHCRHGLGRSPGAAIAVARAYGLPRKGLAAWPRWPNPHVRRLLARALRAL